MTKLGMDTSSADKLVALAEEQEMKSDFEGALAALLLAQSKGKKDDLDSKAKQDTGDLESARLQSH